MPVKLKIEIEASLFLDLTYKRGNEVRVARNIPGFFVGLEHGKFVSVRLSEDSTAKFYYYFSNLSHIIVKYILKGRAYAFSTELLSKVDEPFPMLYLAYPTEIESHPLRKEPRVKGNPAVTVIADEREFKAYLSDISVSGCRVDFSEKFEDVPAVLGKGRSVEIKFRLPGFSEIFEAEGSLKWIRPLGDVLCAGVVFSSMGESTLKCLASFMEVGQPDV